MGEQPNVLTAGEAQRYLRLAPATFRRMVRSGQIPCWQDPETQRRRYPRASLDVFLASFAATDRKAS